MNPNFRYALFDLDGTLIDSMSVWRDKMFLILRDYGVNPSEELVQELTPLGDREIYIYCRKKYHMTVTEDEMRAQMDAYSVPQYRDHIRAKEGTQDYLKKLSEQGIGIFLLTASPARLYEPCLSRLGMLSFFTKTWCCEDFHTHKGDPEIYRMAAEQMGARDYGEIMFFDDNKQALQTAKSVGYRTVGVYDETSAYEEAAIRETADRYIHSFRELL